jgi:hypothetical protein
MVAGSASVSFPTSTTSPASSHRFATTAHGCVVPAASGQLASKPDQPDHDQVDSNDVVQEVRHDQNQNPRDEGDDWLQNYDFHGVLPGFWCADRALLLRQNLLLHRPELATDLRWRNYPRKIPVDARRSKVEEIDQHRG